jgi:hypothetical protein
MSKKTGSYNSNTWLESHKKTYFIWCLWRDTNLPKVNKPCMFKVLEDFTKAYPLSLIKPINDQIVIISPRPVWQRTLPTKCTTPDACLTRHYTPRSIIFFLSDKTTWWDMSKKTGSYNSNTWLESHKKTYFIWC